MFPVIASLSPSHQPLLVPVWHPSEWAPSSLHNKLSLYITHQLCTTDLHATTALHMYKLKVFIIRTVQHTRNVYHAPINSQCTTNNTVHHPLRTYLLTNCNFIPVLQSHRPTMLNLLYNAVCQLFIFCYFCM